MQKQKAKQKMINYTFCHGKFKFAKIFAKFQKPNLCSRKTENVQILFKGICAKICTKCLRKNCAISFLLFQTFQRAIQCRNPMFERRSKDIFKSGKSKIRPLGNMPEGSCIRYISKPRLEPNVRGTC